MSLSRTEQQRIQIQIDGASQAERHELQANTELLLAELNRVLGERKLTAEEVRSAEVAVETLLRAEAREQNKGWWFRVTRRVQLMQMYLDS
jgi:hypothetical protein